MQFCEVSYNILAYLQMPLVGNVFAAHHVDYVLIPHKGFGSLLVIPLCEVREIVFLDKINVEVKCSHHILYLPHIYQIFGNIVFS